MANKQTAVEWLYGKWSEQATLYLEDLEQAKAMEKEQMLDFGEFIIDELEPMAQNRDWVEERYNHFKLE
jgi:hypothetical protein